MTASSRVITNPASSLVALELLQARCKGVAYDGLPQDFDDPTASPQKALSFIQAADQVLSDPSAPSSEKKLAANNANWLTTWCLQHPTFATNTLHLHLKDIQALAHGWRLSESLGTLKAGFEEFQASSFEQLIRTVLSLFFKDYQAKINRVEKKEQEINDRLKDFWEAQDPTDKKAAFEKLMSVMGVAFHDKGLTRRFRREIGKQVRAVMRNMQILVEDSDYYHFDLINYYYPFIREGSYAKPHEDPILKPFWQKIPKEMGKLLRSSLFELKVGCFDRKSRVMDWGKYYQHLETELKNMDTVLLLSKILSEGGAQSESELRRSVEWFGGDAASTPADDKALHLYAYLYNKAPDGQQFFFQALEQAVAVELERFGNEAQATSSDERLRELSYAKVFYSELSVKLAYLLGDYASKVYQHNNGAPTLTAMANHLVEEMFADGLPAEINAESFDPNQHFRQVFSRILTSSLLQPVIACSTWVKYEGDDCFMLPPVVPDASQPIFYLPNLKGFSDADFIDLLAKVSFSPGLNLSLNWVRVQREERNLVGVRGLNNKEEFDCIPDFTESGISVPAELLEAMRRLDTVKAAALDLAFTNTRKRINDPLVDIGTILRKLKLQLPSVDKDACKSFQAQREDLSDEFNKIAFSSVQGHVKFNEVKGQLLAVEEKLTALITEVRKKWPVPYTNVVRQICSDNPTQLSDLVKTGVVLPPPSQLALPPAALATSASHPHLLSLSADCQGSSQPSTQPFADDDPDAALPPTQSFSHSDDSDAGAQMDCGTGSAGAAGTAVPIVKSRSEPPPPSRSGRGGAVTLMRGGASRSASASPSTSSCDSRASVSSHSTPPTMSTPSSATASLPSAPPPLTGSDSWSSDSYDTAVVSRRTAAGPNA